MSESTCRTIDAAQEKGHPAAARSIEPQGDRLDVSRRASLVGLGAEGIDQALAAMAERLAALSADVERLRALLASAPDGPATRGALDEHASYLARRRGSTAVSKRERAVLAQLLDGMSNREISRELGISEKTVKNHLWKLYRKLGVRSRTQLLHSFLCAPVSAGDSRRETAESPISRPATQRAGNPRRF